jgi:hypothetical protein
VVQEGNLMNIPDSIYDEDGNEFKPYIEPGTGRQLGFLERKVDRIEKDVKLWDVVYCGGDVPVVVEIGETLQWAWGLLLNTIVVESRGQEPAPGVLADEDLAQVMPVMEPDTTKAEEERRYRALKVAAVWAADKGYTGSNMLFGLAEQIRNYLATGQTPKGE